VCDARFWLAIEDVLPDVQVFMMHRKQRYDLAAFWRLSRYNQQHNIRLIHAHNHAYFVAVVASLLPPFPKVIWHDHYGPTLIERNARPLKLARHRIAKEIAVNHQLRDWAVQTVGFPSQDVVYLPNFVVLPPQNASPQLPGKPGCRIVCVANLRPQKNMLNLVQAMQKVVSAIEDAHLLIVGSEDVVPDYAQQVRKAIAQVNLKEHITLLGLRTDINNILPQCDIGVLSSDSEGLPLVLIEFGLAGLACVSTDVGECAAVLNNGNAGILVPPQNAERLADALIHLLENVQKREMLGKALSEHVNANFGADTIMKRMADIYQEVLSG